MLMLDNWLLLRNALSPKLVNSLPSAKVTVSSVEIFEKADEPISVTDAGMLTVTRFERLATLWPMACTAWLFPASSVTALAITMRPALSASAL